MKLNELLLEKKKTKKHRKSKPKNMYNSSSLRSPIGGFGGWYWGGGTSYSGGSGDSGGDGGGGGE